MVSQGLKAGTGGWRAEEGDQRNRCCDKEGGRTERDGDLGAADEERMEADAVRRRRRGGGENKRRSEGRGWEGVCTVGRSKDGTDSLHELLY